MSLSSEFSSSRYLFLRQQYDLRYPSSISSTLPRSQRNGRPFEGVVKPILKKDGAHTESNFPLIKSLFPSINSFFKGSVFAHLHTFLYPDVVHHAKVLRPERYTDDELGNNIATFAITMERTFGETPKSETALSSFVHDRHRTVKAKSSRHDKNSPVLGSIPTLDIALSALAFLEISIQLHNHENKVALTSEEEAQFYQILRLYMELGDYAMPSSLSVIKMWADFADDTLIDTHTAEAEVDSKETITLIWQLIQENAGTEWDIPVEMITQTLRPNEQARLANTIIKKDS
jgi:hypothetical protein